MEGQTRSYTTTGCREGMFRLIDVSDFHDVQAVPMNARQQAIVLLGPTGSGKTPLGHILQTNGFQGRPCVHFDFGENLRQVAAQTEPDQWMTSADLALLRRVLTTGALLEDEDFPIAHRLLLSFLQRSGANAHTLVVMNGLPRHAGQAQALAPSLDVPAVIVLQCSPKSCWRESRATLVETGPSGPMTMCRPLIRQAGYLHSTHTSLGAVLSQQRAQRSSTSP